eukprot:10869231-Karenia_brevis.AAC.1
MYSPIFRQGGNGGGLSKFRRQVAGSTFTCDTNPGGVDTKGLPVVNTQSQRLASAHACSDSAASAICLPYVDGGTLVEKSVDSRESLPLDWIQCLSSSSGTDISTSRAADCS